MSLKVSVVIQCEHCSESSSFSGTDTEAAIAYFIEWGWLIRPANEIRTFDMHICPSCWRWSYKGEKNVGVAVEAGQGEAP